MFAFSKVEPSRSTVWVLYFFIGLAVTGTIFTWQGPISLLPLIGNTASGIAFWQKKTKLIRRWSLLPPPFWFTYNALSGSIPGIFIELVDMMSLLIGTYRFDIRKTRKEKQNFSM